MEYTLTNSTTEDGVCTVVITAHYKDGGMYEPTLNAIEYITPPKDGVQELQLSAKFAGPGDQVTAAKLSIEGISASFTKAEWYTGFRIIGAKEASGAKSI